MKGRCQAAFVRQKSKEGNFFRKMGNICRIAFFHFACSTGRKARLMICNAFVRFFTGFSTETGEKFPER